MTDNGNSSSETDMDTDEDTADSSELDVISSQPARKIFHRLPCLAHSLQLVVHSLESWQTTIPYSVTWQGTPYSSVSSKIFSGYPEAYWKSRSCCRGKLLHVGIAPHELSRSSANTASADFWIAREHSYLTLSKIALDQVAAPALQAYTLSEYLVCVETWPQESEKCSRIRA